MPYTKGIIHFDESVCGIQSRHSPNAWFRIFTKNAKGKGGWWIKAAIAEMTATKESDFMWHDFYKIKSYGSAQPPNREKRARKGKWVGLSQRGERRHGVLLVDQVEANGDHTEGFEEQEKPQDQSLSGSNQPGIFYDNLLNHVGQVHTVIFMFVVLQR